MAPRRGRRWGGSGSRRQARRLGQCRRRRQQHTPGGVHFRWRREVAGRRSGRRRPVRALAWAAGAHVLRGADGGSVLDGITPPAGWTFVEPMPPDGNGFMPEPNTEGVGAGGAASAMGAPFTPAAGLAMVGAVFQPLDGAVLAVAPGPKAGCVLYSRRIILGHRRPVRTTCWRPLQPVRARPTQKAATIPNTGFLLHRFPLPRQEECGRRVPTPSRLAPLGGGYPRLPPPKSRGTIAADSRWSVKSKKSNAGTKNEERENRE